MNKYDKLDRKKKLVSLMIEIYCKNKHKCNTLCDECSKLKAYALQRSEKCKFIETKSFCSSCKVHCYSPQMRSKIREVMRFSGPRMIFYHPIIAISHMLESRK